MERITSRKNRIIAELRLLGRETEMRREQGLYLCDGVKLLEEALHAGAEIETVLWKENVQDPGNVGTVIRTANALGIGAVLLTGACADLYSPKTVRATMGAIFRQRTERYTLSSLTEALEGWGLPLVGAVLSERAQNILATDVTHCAVAIGSEGSGLSRELIDLCRNEVIIPMQPDSESLNAAVAASIFMWEMRGRA